MQNGQKLWKGAVSGAVAGLAASWAMNQFESLWSRIQKQQSGQTEPGEDEDATMKAANLAAEEVLHRELSKPEKRKAAPYFHYGFGTLMGALYGVLSEEFPSARWGFGTAFATGLFLVADEGAVPALKLSKSAKEVPLSSHVEALASHLVYGVSTEAARRGMRAALGRGHPSTEAIKSKAKQAKNAAVHWEVPTRGEIRRKLSKVQKSATKAMRQVA